MAHESLVTLNRESFTKWTKAWQKSNSKVSNWIHNAWTKPWYSLLACAAIQQWSISIFDSLENMTYVTHSWDNMVPDLNGSMHESVRILSMNVCGLSDWKLADGILGSHFKRFDIILLQETLLWQRGWSRWTWSNCRRGDLGQYGWMHDEIGGGTWSQCVPPSVHGTYSWLTAVLLGACSYAKWSIFWVITIMYVMVYICMFIFLFINLACHFHCICYFILLTKRACLTQVMFYHLHTLYCQKWRNKDVQLIIQQWSISIFDIVLRSRYWYLISWGMV